MQIAKSSVFNWVPKITKARCKIMRMDDDIAIQVGVKQVTVFAWLWFGVASNKQINKAPNSH